MNGTTIGNLSQDHNHSHNSNNNNNDVLARLHDITQNGYSDQQEFSQFSQFNQDKFDMEELARDINNNLPENALGNMETFYEKIDESVENTTKEENESFEILSSIHPLLKDAVIILIIYIILSQAVVRDTIGKYIKQINPDDEGKFSFVAVLIYGLILATLFVLVKKLIL